MGRPTPGPVSRRGRPSPVDADFREYRNRITALYCEENKPLPEVMQLMKDQHGFSATIKQYKDRLALWKLSKNIRCHEMPHLARIKVQRDAVGKKTRLKLHGSVVDSSKVDRWIRTQEKKMGCDNFRSFIATNVSTPSEIGYETPDDHDNDYSDPSPPRSEILSPEQKGSSELTASSSPRSCPAAMPKSFRLVENFANSPPLISRIYQDRGGPPPISEERTVRQNEDGDLQPPIFEISMSPSQLKVKVFSSGLLSDMCTALMSDSYRIDEEFDGAPLLARFSSIKTHLIDLAGDGLVGSNRVEELGLLVHGCLEDLSVYRSFGRPHLEENVLLDEELHCILKAQELDDSIAVFNQAFLDIDDNERCKDLASKSPALDLLAWDLCEDSASITNELDPYSFSYPDTKFEELSVFELNSRGDFYELSSREQLAVREKLRDAIQLGDASAAIESIFGLREALNIQWRGPPLSYRWLRPFMIDACGYGHTPIVQYLVAFGAETNWELGSLLCGTTPGIKYDENTTTPIIEASKAGHLDIVEMLLENMRWEKSPTSLHGAFIAALRSCQTEIAELLRHEVSNRAELLGSLTQIGDQSLHEQARGFLLNGSAQPIAETRLRSTLATKEPINLARDLHQLPTFRKFQRGKFLNFRANFIHQHSLLQLAAESSQDFEVLARSLPSYRDLWKVAIATMRSMSRGLPPTDSAAMAVLCVSRALAETANSNTTSLLWSFAEDMERWSSVFPLVREVANIMWDISGMTIISYEELYGPSYEAFSILRDFTTALVETATQFFGLRNRKRDKEVGGYHPYQWTGRDIFGVPEPVRTEEPPDRLIPSDANGQKGDSTGAGGQPLVSLLVAGVIFALVVLFMIAFSRPNSTTVLGFPNPWFSDAPQTISIDSSTKPEQSPLSRASAELLDPMLLSRPSTPLLENWQPGLSSLPDMSQLSSPDIGGSLWGDDFLGSTFDSW